MRTSILASGLLCTLVALGCGSGDGSQAGSVNIILEGYVDDAMEPFVSADGRYLFFNNSNQPGTDTNLLYAERQNDGRYSFRGPVSGVNSSSLDAVASMDSFGTFYFISTRSYDQTRSTLYSGSFNNGAVTGVGLVAGLASQAPGMVIFDAAVSPDGQSLILSEGQFSPGSGVPLSADLVFARKSADGFARAPDSANFFRNINTAALEYAAALSSDGLTLYFTRVADATGAANPQIMVTTRSSADQAFANARAVSGISGFAEAPALSPDGRMLYYHQKVGDHIEIRQLPVGH